MLNHTVRPTTVEGVKRLAAQLRKQQKIKHSDALDLAARAANRTNFRHAQRTLPARGGAVPRPNVFLTIYWSDKKQSYQCGRETLRIDLSAPILNLCTKFALKHVRGFGNLRMVSEDHFVCDAIAPSQDYARERLCTAERSLRFMEYTGLRFARNHRKAYPKGLANDKLPSIDHATDWVDPSNGQYVLIDEPYEGVPDEAERADWAVRNGWSIVKTSWPGMYNPYSCDLYVAVDGSSGYDIDALVAKINAMPAPLLVGNWNGESSPTWDTFCSPMAKTKQDIRRARCRGMIYPLASKTTVPYSFNPGSSQRRPIGEFGIEGHIEAGRIIKAVLRSEQCRSGCFTRLSSLRATLEDWLSHEIGRGQLEGPEFFNVYYNDTDDDKVYRKTMKSSADIIAALNVLRQKLLAAYPDCAPLRQQLRRIEMSISLID